MDVALRRPLLYDLAVKGFGKSNIHTHTYSGKNIVLIPFPPKSSYANKKIDW